jgi:hypothetical protein
MRILIVVFLIFMIPFAGEAYKPVDIGNLYNNDLLVPDGKPTLKTAFTGHLLTFPVGVVGQLSVPVLNRTTVFIYGGFSAYPVGFIGSAALKLHLLIPDQNHWGLSTQLQWGIANTVWGGEGAAGGNIGTILVVISSPVKPTRFNLGAALHTMPGSEYKSGWKEAKDYGFKNPQPTIFLSVGQSIGRFTISSDLLWIAVGADEGWDSLFIGALSLEFPISRKGFKMSGGIIIERFGAQNTPVLPLPPIISLSIPF